MAKFFWVGGATTSYGNYTNPLGNFSGKTGAENMDWILAFDFNHPRNWRIQSSFNGAFSMATRSPAGGDEIVFGTSITGGQASLSLPAAVAPCLWGGCTWTSGLTGTIWFGGGQTGSDTTQGLVGTSGRGLMQVNIDGNGGRRNTQYPFKFLGLPAGFASSANGNVYTSPLLDAAAAGFSLDSNIWSGLSWEALVASVAATGAAALDRLNRITVRTPFVVTNQVPGTGRYFGSYDPATGVNSGLPLRSEPNHGSVNINILKDKEGFSGGHVASTLCSLKGPASFRLSGYPAKIYRYVTSGGEYYLPPPGTPFYSPRNHLTLVGATVGYLEFEGSGIYMDSTTNISQARITPLNHYHLFEVYNKFNRSAVLNDIWYGSGASFAGVSGANIKINLPQYGVTDPVATPNGGGGGVNYFGVILGSAGVTVACDEMEIGGYGIYGATQSEGPNINVNVAGNLKINNMKLTNGRLRGWKEGGVEYETIAQIGQLSMDLCSELDFAHTENWNGWQFGVLGTSGQIDGGIVFLDENSKVKGSNGVRLWNEQLLIVGQLLANAPSKLGGRINTIPSLTTE